MLGTELSRIYAWKVEGWDHEVHILSIYGAGALRLSRKCQAGRGVTISSPLSIMAALLVSKNDPTSSFPPRQWRGLPSPLVHEIDNPRAGQLSISIHHHSDILRARLHIQLAMQLLNDIEPLANCE